MLVKFGANVCLKFNAFINCLAKIIDKVKTPLAIFLSIEWFAFLNMCNFEPFVHPWLSFFKSNFYILVFLCSMFVLAFVLSKSILLLVRITEPYRTKVSKLIQLKKKSNP